jgi:hypothetical protein
LESQPLPGKTYPWHFESVGDLIDAPHAQVKIDFMANAVKKFRDLYCERLGISPAAFEKKILLASLPGYYRGLGLVRWHLNRSYFKRDLEVIRAVAECTSLRDLRSELTFYHHQKVTGLQRNVLRFRLSGKRLLSVANKFLP